MNPQRTSGISGLYDSECSPFSAWFIIYTFDNGLTDEQQVSWQATGQLIHNFSADELDKHRP
jgi:hypothetical protein